MSILCKLLVALEHDNIQSAIFLFTHTPILTYIHIHTCTYVLHTTATTSAADFVCVGLSVDAAVEHQRGQKHAKSHGFSSSSSSPGGRLAFGMIRVVG